MKGFCESFRKSPMTAFADWQETREPWILFGVTSIILVLLAHYLFQGWLIEVYQASDGWYLFPQWKFMDMAECCMLACVCYAALLLVLLAAWGMRAMKKA